MHLPVLVQPIEGGRFRARVGEPFALSAEAATPQEATKLLADQLEQCLRSGSVLSSITITNGATAHFDFVPVPEDEWFFDAMREGIAENRAREEKRS